MGRSGRAVPSVLSLFFFLLTFITTVPLAYGVWAQGLAPDKIFMPENNLHLEKQVGDNGMTEEKFDAILDRYEKYYTPIFKALGVNLVVNRYWDNGTVNASAMQRGKNWHINMYGGLARRMEVTADGFEMVVCHELGHHIGGVPFKGGYASVWAASEGQSDYFASVGCARYMWRDQTELNDKAEEELLALEGGDDVKAKCDLTYMDVEERKLCYRTARGGHSLATLLGSLRRGTTPPQFTTPDQKKVSTTFIHHPQAQCRLDTYLAGALCDVPWDDQLIPGKEYNDKKSLLAYIQAKPHSCHRDEDELGARPRCWFAPEDINIPDIKFDLLSEKHLIEEQEWIELDQVEINPKTKVSVEMKGTGDADLYVRFGDWPSLETFDCRPFLFGSDEACTLTAPNDGPSYLFAKVSGWSKESDVTIDIKTKATAKLCRHEDHGGIGAPFECFGDYQCKLIEDLNPEDQFNWCIVY